MDHILCQFYLSKCLSFKFNSLCQFVICVIVYIAVKTFLTETDVQIFTITDASDTLYSLHSYLGDKQLPLLCAPGGQTVHNSSTMLKFGSIFSYRYKRYWVPVDITNDYIMFGIITLLPIIRTNFETYYYFRFSVGHVGFLTSAYILY